MDKQVQEFMSKFGHLGDKDAPKLYRQFIIDEFQEFKDSAGTLGSICEAVDLIYVALGYILAHGYDPKVLFDAIHAKNMMKEKGIAKVRKPEGWEPVDPLALTESARLQ